MTQFLSIKNFRLIMSVIYDYFDNKYDYQVSKAEEHIVKQIMARKIQRFNGKLPQGSKFMLALNKECISEAIIIITGKLDELRKKVPPMPVNKDIPVANPQTNDITTQFEKLSAERSFKVEEKPRTHDIQLPSDGVNKNMDQDYAKLMSARDNDIAQAKQNISKDPSKIKEFLNLKEEPELKEDDFPKPPDQVLFENVEDNKSVTQKEIIEDIMENPMTLGQELIIKRPKEYEKLVEDIYNDPKYLKTEYLVVDSRDRNTDEYPDPQDYIISLERDYKDVISVELISANIPKTQYLINNSNNKLYFDDGTGTVTATIPIGNYTISELTAEIKTQMDAASGSKTYTVTSNSKTNKITIAVNSGTYSLIFNGGEENYENSSRTKYVDSSIGPIIGFSRSDLSGSATYTGQNQYDLNGPTYVLLWIKEFEQLKGVHNSSVTDSFAKIVLDTDISSYKYFKSQNDYIAKKNFRPLKGRLSRLNIKFYNYDGSEYDFGGLNHTLYFKLITLNQNQNYFK